MAEQGRVVIVDAYSTGRHLAPLLLQHGWTCTHVQSLPTPAFGRGHDLSHFVASHVHDGSLHSDGVMRTAELLRPWGPTAVLAGSESALPLCDLLAHALGTPGNNATSAWARRDKYAMQIAVKHAGLEVARCFEARTPADAVAAARTIAAPVVVKPVLSAAAEDVRFCWDDRQVIRACDATLGKKNALGVVNDAVLVQEMLLGTEYIVNGVTSRGEHHLSELWRCRKSKHDAGKRLSGLEELVPVASSTEVAVIEFARRALDALDFVEGPSHMELIATDDGCRLIEVAARPQGGVDPSAMLSAIGTSHPHLVVEALVRPHTFTHRAFSPNTPVRRVYRVVLKCDRAGRVASTDGLERLRRLASYYSDTVQLGVGDEVMETIDFVTTPGVLHLVHDDVAQLERDYVVIRELERANALFGVIQQ